MITSDTTETSLLTYLGKGKNKTNEEVHSFFCHMETLDRPFVSTLTKYEENGIIFFKSELLKGIDLQIGNVYTLVSIESTLTHWKKPAKMYICDIELELVQKREIDVYG